MKKDVKTAKQQQKNRQTTYLKIFWKRYGRRIRKQKSNFKGVKLKNWFINLTLFEKV